MSEVDFKNALLAGDPARVDETGEVKTFAGVVVVRGLTRAEVLEANRLRGDAQVSTAEYEQWMVSTAMVTPTMTAAEVEKWQAIDKAGGPLADVTDKIAELSGLSEGASKSGVPRART
ncbi:MAG TPA: hypothetical protein VIQ30_18850 [Pseudonocardia sp.]